MNCNEFAEWLDRGGELTYPGAAAATVHVSCCSDCARTLESVRRAVLVFASSYSAPDDLLERTMAQVVTPLDPALSHRPGARFGLRLEVAGLFAGVAALGWTFLTVVTSPALRDLDSGLVVGIIAGALPSIIWVSSGLYRWPLRMLDRP